MPEDIPLERIGASPEEFTRALVAMVKAQRDLVDARRPFYAANLQAPAARFVEASDALLELMGRVPEDEE